ncbi:trehalose-phosphatase [Microbacterium testaceum]|uniref:Trehalose 6-phosphate phosphatase n=1 Tax=Microbacterium testaceum TaxID=2033 RepID=A0A147F7C9_MICTE|nr:trehalose-phosphatase [Microbacterium testaceum]KTS11576.1 trehalose phosphatase [Microbacterium testaceum]
MTAADATIEAVATTDRLLIAVDFDGTLSPLVDEPMSARMTPGARVVLGDLVTLPRTVVALVSGRSLGHLREIAEHTDDSLIWLAGSHGVQFWVPGVGVESATDDDADLALRDQLQDEVSRRAAGTTGVWIEPKEYGFGVHTRTADAETARAVREIADELVAAEAPGWRRRTGHDILEFSFRHEGKDSAVAHLRERVGATAVLFAGDDVTDEDALRSLGPGDLGIRVGGGETAATLRVDDIDAFVTVLEDIARLRRAHTD